MLAAAFVLLFAAGVLFITVSSIGLIVRKTRRRRRSSAFQPLRSVSFADCGAAIGN